MLARHCAAVKLAKKPATYVFAAGEWAFYTLTRYADLRLTWGPHGAFGTNSALL